MSPTKLISAMLVFCILLSCDKALEEDPQNKLKPDSVEDYEELLNYGYPTTKDYGTMVPLDYYVAMMTDDMDIRYFNSQREGYAIHPFSFEDTQENPSMINGYDQAWKNFYQSIYYANVVISNIDNAKGDISEKKYVKGEAMALRAFAYFKLINLYAQPYNKGTASSDLGVPLKLDPTVQASSYHRNTVQEVYNQINSDIKKGLSLMTENNQNISSKYKLRPISTCLLASRIFLFQKNYDKTIDYATKVLDLNNQLFDLSGFTLNYAQTHWGYGQGTHYMDDTNPNVLFKYGSNEFYEYVFYPGALALSDDFMNLFEPGDLRLYYFSYIKGSLGRVYFKFRPFPNRLGQPIRGFRVEEAYLNRAEAYAMKGQMKKALQDINTIRKAKFSASFGSDPNYYMYSISKYNTKDKVIQAVRDERRRELFGEFHRWYDLRRYGMPKIVHHFDGKTFILKHNDLRYVLQIPQSELNFNPQMQKNPR